MVEKKYWYLNEQDHQVLQAGREQTLIWNALRSVMAIKDMPPIPLGASGEAWLAQTVEQARRYDVMNSYHLPLWLEIAHRGGENFWQLEDVQAVLNAGAINDVRINTLLQMADLEQRPVVETPAQPVDFTQHAVYRWCEAGLPLWARVDGAFDAAPQGFACGLDVAHYSLFNSADRALESHGPWLIAAWMKPRMVQYLLSRPAYAINTLWLVADGEVEDIVTHLQGLLYVRQGEGEGGSRFRFHDPRVFATWINSLAPERLDDFFGPVQRWFSPDPNPLWSAQQLQGYSQMDNQLERRIIATYPPRTGGDA